MPAGRIENKEKEYNVRLMGEAASPLDFGKIVINNRTVLGANHKNTRLNQVAFIEEATADVRRISRFNGQLAVGLGILKQHGSNAVEVAKLVREKAKEIGPGIPKKYHLEVRSDATRFIKQAVDELNFTLILSALLTSLVCYVFLGSWTSTLNVLLAIPTSIIGAFIVFFFMNFTLNTFTLLGLSLAIGIVVDDAIMMLENIVRHRELGLKKREAAIVGAQEITFAALAATIAVVAIFLPVIFMKGVIGRYFYQYGITVAAAVLLSLLEALTLTPMRCSRFLAINHSGTGLAGFVDRSFAKLSSAYQKSLAFLLRWRWTTLIATTLIFIGSFMIAKHLPSEMMPAQDQSQMLLRVKLKIGTSLEITNSKFLTIEDYLSKQPEVDGYYTAVGGFGGDAVNQGMAFVTLVDPGKRKKTQSELIKQYRKDLKVLIKGIEINVQDLSLRGFSSGRGFPVEFIVQGPDWDKLTEETKILMQAMRDSGIITDVNTDVQDGAPEFRITPDRAKMAAHGVSISAVTEALNELIGGDILNGTTEYPKDGHRYEIEVRMIAAQRNKAEQLKTIYVRNNYGSVVPLSEITDISEAPALQLISRLNRQRAITVYGNPVPGHSQQEALDISTKLGKQLLPKGYYMTLTGSSQSYKESFESLVFALLFGIVVSYMVLASQFNSFLHPVVVLMALPFSFTGAFLALWIGHQTINIYSLIGFILLMGIVKKNSILLVDFTNHVRNTEDGITVNNALLKACPVRLRPIIMTSMATVAGALPEALAIGPGAETTIPMATAIIGGVIASTILTLFVVPCTYSLISRLEKPDTLLKDHDAAHPLAAEGHSKIS